MTKALTPRAAPNWPNMPQEWFVGRLKRVRGIWNRIAQFEEKPLPQEMIDELAAFPQALRVYVSWSSPADARQVVPKRGQNAPSAQLAVQASQFTTRLAMLGPAPGGTGCKSRRAGSAIRGV